MAKKDRAVARIFIHFHGAVDKTSSSFSAHGKIGNFIALLLSSPSLSSLLSLEK